ncbi:MAG: M56 family metallopeptidase, partial [Tannerellaceae bacterium]|nr:M56 family metallopeptidase [Tannerellaceae bacterium]
MGAFFIYILKSAVCLAAFYLFYKLFLSRDTFHRFNRLTLWSLLLLSMLIPLSEVTMKEPVIMQQTVLDWEAVLMTASVAATSTGQGAPLWVRLMLLVYIGGGVFFLCRFLFSCIRMFHLMRKGAKRRLNGVWLILTPEPVVSFSWMRYIVISEKDWAESGEEILTHEMAHIQNRHSFDLLLAEACILLYWFNPAAWLIKRELQHIHEYEADESVIRKGIDAKKYQLLLIKKAVGTQRFTSVANSFNHSSLKKRISMMLKKKSNPWARLKYLYVLPLAACAIAAFARPEISHELEKISSVKLSEIIPDIQIPPDTIRMEKPLASINIEDIDEKVDVDVDVDTDVDVNVEIEDIKIDLAAIREEIRME